MNDAQTPPAATCHLSTNKAGPLHLPWMWPGSKSEKGSASGPCFCSFPELLAWHRLRKPRPCFKHAGYPTKASGSSQSSKVSKTILYEFERFLQKGRAWAKTKRCLTFSCHNLQDRLHNMNIDATCEQGNFGGSITICSSHKHMPSRSCIDKL